MSASLISPSGKVLLRRARCSTQPGPDPLAMPVLIALPAVHDPAASPPDQHSAPPQRETAEADMAR